MKKYSHGVITTALMGSLLIGASIETAQATTAFSAISLGANIGTTGLGVQLSTPLWSHYLNLNAGYSGFGFSYHARVDGQEYRGNLRLGGEPIYLSAYPFGGNFHLDAGVFINQNHINVSAEPNSNGTYVINGKTYHVETLGTVSGQTHFHPVAPYFGLGWGNPFLGGRWTFTANAGVILEGGAKAGLSAATEADIPGATDSINAYAHTFNHDVSILTAYPVVNIGVAYRF